MNNYIRGYVLLMWPFVLSLAVVFHLISALEFGVIAVMIMFAYVGQRSIIRGLDLIAEQNRMQRGELQSPRSHHIM